MAPQLTYGRHHVPPPLGSRYAAVLVLLSPVSGSTEEKRSTETWHTNEWELTLTRRASHLPDHPGQICFPGGRQEMGEDNSQCALREWTEELGDLPDPIHVLGQLPGLYVYASHHWVVPVLALSPQVPSIRPNPSEVDCTFSLSFGQLSQLQPSRRLIRRGGLRFYTPQYSTPGGNIWGATAMMLELINEIWRSRLHGSLGA
jgi:8-oxo-dGTP pyrophosphatase MutT (NUDIX family)